MNGIKFKIKTSTILLALFISLQVFSPLQALATSPVRWDTPQGPNPLTFTAKDFLNPRLLVSVVGCTGIVNKIAERVLNLTKAITTKLLGKLIKKKVFSIVGGAVVPVKDDAQTEQIKKDNEAAAEDRAKTENREACLNGIAIALAKQQLEKITRSTLNWVGTGFGGDPLFVRNTNIFMDNITNNILKRESDFFGAPENASRYPYGQDYKRAEVYARRSQMNFDDSVAQNLTDYLSPGATIKTFANDFSQGGWNGWLALTQNPQNNPLGFEMLVAEHTAEKIATEKENTKQELIAGNGVLNQKKCAVYGLTEKRAQSRLTILQTNINEAQKELDRVQLILKQINNDPESSPSDKEGAARNVAIATQVLNRARSALAQANVLPSGPNDKGECAVWETVTPGSTIKDKIAKTLNSPETQLELVRTINDALGWLFTALLNRLQGQGLSSLVTGPFENVSGSFGSNNIVDSFGNIVPGTNRQNGGASYLPFDITRDLPRIIKNQKDYIENATNFLTVTDKVLPALGELDYCIPGPNANWAQIADPSIENDERFEGYSEAVEQTFGASSPMQKRGSSSYLAMSYAGLSLVGDLASTEENILSQQETANTDISKANINIPKLKKIKEEVDAIVDAAVKRQNAERARLGLPPVDQSCREVN